MCVHTSCVLVHVVCVATHMGGNYGLESFDDLSKHAWFATGASYSVSVWH